VKRRILLGLKDTDIISDVRLLYAGRILNEGDILSDVLKQLPPDCEMFTIHLSCSVLHTSTGVNSDRSQEQSGSNSSNNVDTSQDYQSWVAMYSGYGYGNTGYDHLYNTDINQLAVVQELYSQYMSQYMQYINMANMTPAPGPGHPQELHHLHQPHQQVAPPAAGNQAPEPEGVRNQVMNAGGGGMMEEDDMNVGADRDRDILDWMYLTSRVVLLLSIVYFYSSIARFLLVACLAGLVYLYQNGMIGGRRERRIRDRERRLEERRERFRERVREFRERIRAMQPNNNNEDDVAINQRNENDVNQNNNTEEAVTEEEIINLRDENQNQEVVPEPPSPWVIASNFIFMFFASLFPENPQVV